MRLVCLFFLTVFSSVLYAQVNCYGETRSRGISLYNSKQYQKAKKTFEITKACPDKPANNDLDSWIKKCSRGSKQMNTRLSAKKSKQVDGFASGSDVAKGQAVKIVNISVVYDLRVNGKKGMTIRPVVDAKGIKRQELLAEVRFCNGKKIYKVGMSSEVTTIPFSLSITYVDLNLPKGKTAHGLLML